MTRQDNDTKQGHQTQKKIISVLIIGIRSIHVHI